MNSLTDRVRELKMQESESDGDSPSDLLDLAAGCDGAALDKLLQKLPQGLPSGPSLTGLSVLRGLQLIEAGKPLEALHLISESHSAFLRQFMILKSSCRLTELQIKRGELVSAWPEGSSEALLDLRRKVLQYKPSHSGAQEMEALINRVPSDWTVVQITARPRVRTRRNRLATPELVVARFAGGRPDSLLFGRVPPPAADSCATFRAEFDSMLQDNASIQRSISNNRHAYWARRGALDDRMKAMVRSMETAWLGRHSYLVSGEPLCPRQQTAVQETLDSLPGPPLTPIQRSHLSLLCCHLPPGRAELTAAVSEILSCPPDSAVCRQLTAALTSRRAQLAAAGGPDAPRGQVILVLDREVQRYPWETVGLLAASPVCRVPSLCLLDLFLALRPVTPPRPASSPDSSATYILNPGGDLKKTEERMGRFLAERGWRGITGRPPTLEEFAAALTDGEIMAYCGHGCGSQYMPSDRLRSLSCRAVALLFGCSSGQLTQPGPTAEPHGSVYNYLMANCPAILGNLWPVTDNMLDTYSKAVIDKWTGGEACEGSLTKAAAAARSAVQSAFMAAAPVVYGLPYTTATRLPADPTAAVAGDEFRTPKPVRPGSAARTAQPGISSAAKQRNAELSVSGVQSTPAGTSSAPKQHSAEPSVSGVQSTPAGTSSAAKQRSAEPSMLGVHSTPAATKDCRSSARQRKEPSRSVSSASRRKRARANDR